MQRLLLFSFLLFPTLRPAAQSIIWVSACTNKTFCLNQGSCTMGNVFMTEQAVTTCAGGFVNYSYKIDLNNNGSIDIQSTADTVTGPFPVGTHSVIWRANDNCGNVSTGCVYQFTIKDCNPPNLLCLNGLTQNLELPQCESTFDVEDFIINYSDNCTPKPAIKLGMRRAGSGTGFPTDTSLTFGLCEQGLHVLEIWVKDENNLVNQCNSYVLVQDNANICECNIDADITLQGCAQTADSTKLDNYTINAQLEGVPIQGPPFTKPLLKNITDSCFSVVFAELPLNGSYSGVVRAQRISDPLIGVSTFDLVQINKHILAQQPLKNFYQVLAADVNQSKSVTTLDIVEIRKLILGVYDTFPNAPAWRFIRPLADPADLIGYDLVRDTYQFAINNLQDDMTFKNFRFVGVKIGDANSNASFTSGPEDRFAGEPLLLHFEDRQLQAGEAVWVSALPDETIELEGWQLALQADAGLLEIKDVQGVPAECVAVNDGAVRLSWIGQGAVRYGPDRPLFQVLVEAKKATNLSAALSLPATSLAPEVYPAEGPSIRPVQLRSGAQASQTVFFPPQPNPSAGGEIAFSMSLEKPATTRLEIFDGSGRQVYQTRVAFDAGYQTLRLPAAATPRPGVWTYRLSAGTQSAVGRLVRM